MPVNLSPRERLNRGIGAGLALESQGVTVYWNGVVDPFDSREAMDTKRGVHGPWPTADKRGWYSHELVTRDA